jgi:glycerol-3-phosphate acyltransferase PlsY
VQLEWAILWAGAYLLGSIPFGLLLGRALGGVDVRAAGSGNIGATNVARTAGKAAGGLVLALDAAKGAAPISIGQHGLEAPISVVVVAGLFAVLGHVFPVWLRFRGGKGVATALGVFLALSPLATSSAIAVLALVFALRRVVSLGSLIASVALVPLVAGLDGRREVLALTVLVAGLVVVRHRGNIRRLLSRQEPEW